MSLIDRVGAVLRDAAARAVMPRFRSLGDGDVEEKSPGELVTIADREAETIISAGLAAIRPGARVVGEEACSRDPSLLDSLGEGEAWIVDPIDGTGNFAAGRAPFSIMAALLRDGDPVAAWLLDPLTDTLVAAEQGAGAWRDGVRVSSPEPAAAPATWRGIASRLFLPEKGHAIAGAVEKVVAAVAPSQRCAGAEYPLVATGTIDFAIYWRSLAWDHAPGTLIVREAGGAVTRLDGSPYRPAEPGTGLIVARTPEVAATLVEIAAGA